jgi:hypothetical protein
LDKVALWQISRLLLSSVPANYHSTLLPYSSITPLDACDVPEQAAQYHLVDLQVGGLMCETRRLVGYRDREIKAYKTNRVTSQNFCKVHFNIIFPLPSQYISMEAGFNDGYFLYYP